MEKQPHAYLSSSITEIKNHYEVVVVGSGYGGSIAASRMARLGKKVCLLERGKEFQPGEYPEKSMGAAAEMQFNLPNKHLGPTTGLYEFHVNKDINVFVGCGLGGTSLVNANVSIEPDKRVFDDDCWPKEISEDWPSLERGLKRAWEMLRPNQYPEGQNGYPILPKVEAMKKAAKAMDADFRYLDINVNFNGGVNHVGIEQAKCDLCGDCVTGCNYGAKNTTLMNYLPDAKNHGAEIYTEVSVSHIEQVNGKWLVHYQLQEAGREKFKAPTLFVSADIVILGAGSLGSTGILMRSKERGLSLSDMLGKRFTGNGDVLGFGYNVDVPINGIGYGHNKPGGKVKAVGPCIGGVIDLRKTEKLEDGFVIEEGSIPGSLSVILPNAFFSFSKLFGKDTDRHFTDFIMEKFRVLKSFLLGGYNGATQNTLTYLVMSHDDGNGAMRLEEDRVRIDWADCGKQKIFGTVNKQLQQATKALGGTFVPSPSWNKLMNFDLVTVHPLGGCVMGKDAESGVVDHVGQVYASSSGTSLHEGLYVTDGAIIPRPLGVNPLLTISALAERSCEIIASVHGKQLNYDFPKVAPAKKWVKPVGIQFTETMTGYFSTSEKNDYINGASLGKANDSPFEFTLTIISDDLQQLLKSEDHAAKMVGTVKAPALSAQPLTVSEGKFNLFVVDAIKEGNRKMNYNMRLHTVEGKEFYFNGFKEAHDDKGFDLWSDTTTLFITIYEGSDAFGPVLGKGVLKILPDNFAKQLTTMKALNATKLESAKAIKDFGVFFSKALVKTYA